MKAVKGNKVYNISEGQKKSYQDAGFDILDDAGKTIAYGRGKTIPYEEYVALQRSNEALTEENAALLLRKEELEQRLSELEKQEETANTSKGKSGKGGE